MEEERPPHEGHGTMELMVEAAVLGVAPAQVPVQDLLVEEALAREGLQGVPGYQHPASEADLVLDFHHHLHLLNSSTGESQKTE